MQIIYAYNFTKLINLSISMVMTTSKGLSISQEFRNAAVGRA